MVTITQTYSKLRDLLDLDRQLHQFEYRLSKSLVRVHVESQRLLREVRSKTHALAHKDLRLEDIDKLCDLIDKVKVFEYTMEDYLIEYAMEDYLISEYNQIVLPGLKQSSSRSFYEKMTALIEQGYRQLLRQYYSDRINPDLPFKVTCSQGTWDWLGEQNSFTFYIEDLHN